MADAGLPLLLGMIALGFRHGFDWDHIAAITDITSTTTTSHADVDVPAGAPVVPRGHSEHLTQHEHSHVHASTTHAIRESRFAHEQRHAIALATLYALGHASMVVVLGIAAIAFAAILPEWIDPILERVVGFTLVLLGVWVLYSLVEAIRGGGRVRLRSRWMLAFDLVRYGWGRIVHGTRTGTARTPRSTGRAPRTRSGSSTASARRRDRKRCCSPASPARAGPARGSSSSSPSPSGSSSRTASSRS
jgi:hypothetical protein